MPANDNDVDNDPAGGGDPGDACTLPPAVRGLVEGTIRDFLLLDPTLDDGAWWKAPQFESPWWEHPPLVESIEVASAD